FVSPMSLCCYVGSVYFFFFTEPATTEIHTLSLHDALPIWRGAAASVRLYEGSELYGTTDVGWSTQERYSTYSCLRSLRAMSLPSDRKSTRLNSSHVKISYAVFCLKKKKTSTLAESQHALRV